MGKQQNGLNAKYVSALICILNARIVQKGGESYSNYGQTIFHTFSVTGGCGAQLTLIEAANICCYFS